MKQHITEEQLNELTEEKKKTLRHWSINHHVDAIPIPIESDFAPTTYDMEYLLSIGQMIEFLGDKLSDFGFKNSPPKFFKGVPSIHKQWKVYLFVFLDGKTYFEADELCDALWEAVKETL